MKIRNHATIFLFTLSLFIGFSLLRFREIKKNGDPTGFSINFQKQVLSETTENEDGSNDASIGSIEEVISKDETASAPTGSPDETAKPPQQNIEIKNEVGSTGNVQDAARPLISDFYYPGATDAGSGEGTLNLSSKDHPNKITDWYKEKIKSLGMNVNSFVTTSSNDKILNKLSAASSSSEINVEISREQVSSETSIKVSLGK